MRLPAGSTLIFQMHYTATGKATTDRTQHRRQVREGEAAEVECASAALDQRRRCTFPPAPPISASTRR